MLSVLNGERNEAHLQDPMIRGYNVVYHANKVNHCPGCGRTHWFVGRLMAECGFCSTAIPLAEASLRGSGHTRAFQPLWQVGKAA